MRFLFSMLLLCFSATVPAQRLWFDAFAGTTNYQGDLQDKRFTFQQSHFSGGMGVSYDLTDHFAARLHFLYGKISGNDKYGKNAARNLNFTSAIFEAQVGAQYYITPLNSRSVTPYVFAGVAVFHFNPYTYDTTGAKYFLKPLSTEGEGIVTGRKPYSLTQLSIPFGGGLKLSLTDNLNVGVELGMRKAFTDYLDDVSTRYVDPAVLLAAKGPKAVELAYRGDELKPGSPFPGVNEIRGSSKYKDWYYFTGVTLSYRLGGGGVGGFGRKEGKFFDCPKSL